MRSFMDEMTFQRAAQGGMEVRMVKRVPSIHALPDPLYLATAVEIVLRAGDIQRAGQESGFRVDKKGSIDLVTEVDLACERMCREMLAERFPDHDILAEELGGSPTGRAAFAIPLGVRSARRHHELRARPADLLLVARRSKSTDAPKSRPSTTRRARSCSPRSGAKAPI